MMDTLTQLEIRDVIAEQLLKITDNAARNYQARNLYAMKEAGIDGIEITTTIKLLNRV